MDLAISGIQIIKSPKHPGLQRDQKETKLVKNDPKPLATRGLGQKYENPFMYVVHT